MPVALNPLAGGAGGLLTATGFCVGAGFAAADFGDADEAGGAESGVGAVSLPAAPPFDGADASVKFSTRMRASSVHLPSGYCFKKA